MVAELAFAELAPFASATQSAAAPHMLIMKPGRQLPHVAEPGVQVALLAMAQAALAAVLQGSATQLPQTSTMKSVLQPKPIWMSAHDT